MLRVARAVAKALVIASTTCLEIACHLCRWGLTGWSLTCFEVSLFRASDLHDMQDQTCLHLYCWKTAEKLRNRLLQNLHTHEHPACHVSYSEPLQFMRMESIYMSDFSD